MKIRMMTSNIWGDYFNNPIPLREDRLTGVFLKYSPDVLGMQEVTDNWHTSKTFDKLREDYFILGDNLANYVNYLPLAIKKKYTILAEGYEAFRDTPSDAKGITWAVIQDNETKEICAVCNTHMWYGLNEIKWENAMELIALMKYIQAKYNCIVFTFGDFNCNIGEYSFEILKFGGAKNLYDLTDDKDNISTYHGPQSRMEDGTIYSNLSEEGPEESIDHFIALGDNFRVIRHRLVTDKDALDVTDHCPLYVDVEF